MAKSLRSKVKRSFRSKKRETGVYAAADAARLNRLNSKLVRVMKEDSSLPVGEIEEDPAADPDDSQGQLEPMSIDSEDSKVSTHGPRGSRREEWRKSKGLAARPTAHGMNRQGTVAAKRKAGRPSRRR